MSHNITSLTLDCKISHLRNSCRTTWATCTASESNVGAFAIFGSWGRYRWYMSRHRFYHPCTPLSVVVISTSTHSVQTWEHSFLSLLLKVFPDTAHPLYFCLFLLFTNLTHSTDMLPHMLFDAEISLAPSEALRFKQAETCPPTCFIIIGNICVNLREQRNIVYPGNGLVCHCLHGR